MAELPAAPTPAPALPLPPSAPPGGSQRLLFSHDLVSGRYRGSVRFGLVRLIHGEDSDSEEEETATAAPGGGGRGAGGAASSGGSESGGPGAGGTEEGRASPLRRGYVRVQWYPEGIKQHVKETKVRGGRGLNVELRRASAPCEGVGRGTCGRPGGRGAAFGPPGCGAVPPVCAERCPSVAERQPCGLLAAVRLCPCLCRYGVGSSCA